MRFARRKDAPLRTTESVTAVFDLPGRNIDVLVGHRDVAGRQLDNSLMPCRFFSPGSFGVHVTGTVYFANERALSPPDRLKTFLAGIVAGWKAVFSPELSISNCSRCCSKQINVPSNIAFMDEQRLFRKRSGRTVWRTGPASD